jgi:hypothetical protein
MLFRRATGVVLAGLVLLLGAAPDANAGGGETIGVAVPGRVACASADLHPDQTVRCTIAGFGATEQVDVTLLSTVGSVTTDAQGGATYDFTVPHDIAAGSYTLTFTGAKSEAVGVFAFTVSVAVVSPTTAPPTTAPPTTAPPTSTSGGGLALTGVDVLAMVAAALALLAAGAALTVFVRRRQS